MSIAVAFGEVVAVTGIPQLPLAIGTRTRQAAYSRGSGTSSLSFNYNVQATDVYADGGSNADSTFYGNTGSIADYAETVNIAVRCPRIMPSALT